MWVVAKVEQYSLAQDINRVKSYRTLGNANTFFYVPPSSPAYVSGVTLAINQQVAPYHYLPLREGPIVLSFFHEKFLSSRPREYKGKSVSQQAVDIRSIVGYLGIV